MLKRDKLLTRIYTLSKDLRSDELRKVLESCGYEMKAPKKWKQSLHIPKIRMSTDYDTETWTN